jgi:hypothetical protein
MCTLLALAIRRRLFSCAELPYTKIGDMFATKHAEPLVTHDKSDSDTNVSPGIALCVELESKMLLHSNSFERNAKCSANRSRLGYLRDSVEELLADFATRFEIVQFDNKDEYQRLLGAVHCVLAQVLDVVEDVSAGRLQVTQHFDMADLSLRRVLCQLEHVYPSALGGRAQSIDVLFDAAEIADAAPLWTDEFGDSVHVISYERFERFVAAIVGRQQGDRSSGNADYSAAKLAALLSYLYNFPKNDMCSSYTFYALVNQFGPLEQLADNLINVGLGQGFLGLINQHSAEEMLRAAPSSTNLIVRLSRGEPHLLTLTYKHGASQSCQNMRHHLASLHGGTWHAMVRRLRLSPKPLNSRINFEIFAQPMTLQGYAKPSLDNSYLVPE